MHVRTTIRDEVKTLLTGLSTTAGRVHSPLTNEIHRANTPALELDVVSETVISTRANVQTRQALLRVTGFVVSTISFPDVSATLDNIDAEVSVALFGGTLSDLTDKMFESMGKEYRIEGDDLVGEITIGYRLLYEVDQSDPSVSA